jgi:hypothetical protein
VHHAEDFVRRTVGEAQERLDFVDRGRHDRQAIGPALFIELLVDGLERATEDDVAIGGRCALCDCLLRRFIRRELADDLVDKRVFDVACNGLALVGRNDAP